MVGLAIPEAWRSWPSASPWAFATGLWAGIWLSLDPYWAIWPMYGLGLAHAIDLLATKKAAWGRWSWVLAAGAGGLSIVLILLFLVPWFATLSGFLHDDLAPFLLVLTCVLPAERAQARGRSVLRDLVLGAMVGALALWPFWDPIESDLPVVLALGWMALLACLALWLPDAARLSLVLLAIPASLASGTLVGDVGSWAARGLEAALWSGYAFASFLVWRDGVRRSGTQVGTGARSPA